MVDTNKAVTQLETLLQTTKSSVSKDDVKKEVDKILSDAGVTTKADRAKVKEALEGKWTSTSAEAVATTGACYFRAGGVLQCQTGLTQTQCDAKPGKFVSGQACGSPIVWEVMEAEHLI